MHSISHFRCGTDEGHHRGWQGKRGSEEGKGNGGGVGGGREGLVRKWKMVVAAEVRERVMVGNEGKSRSGDGAKIGGA